MKSIYLFLIIAVLGVSAYGQTDHDKMDHDKMVQENGEKAMGFSQTATTHHFLVTNDGGAIQVEVNDPKDSDNRGKIRMHLKMIAKEFQRGVFTTPFAVHGQVPPGVPMMDKRKGSIAYSYEQTKKGARVRIKTSDPDALEAIHAFLKFQIEEHKTGDPVTLPN
jgi:NADPH-dependent glutamate synthase beta subunit-like oxidoreductase